MQRNNSKIKVSAVRVLRLEAEAISHLAKDLPRDFEKVVKLVINLSGHLVISGIGKSGHIGRKIAATLASTGTPSYFVHSTEASHGDLGSLTTKDACLLISNSGETEELKNLIEHVKRFAIPLIAISSKTNSSLMQAADFKLNLPKAQEACSIGLAPTTSTTLTLALGDALAVALMEERHFSPEAFKIFHPGGKLGKHLLRVNQLMHTDKKIPIVDASSSMGKALLEMTSKGFGIVAVLKKKLLYGVITDGDLRRHMDYLMKKKAGEIASKNPVSIKADTLAYEALSIMNLKKISALLVVNNKNQPIGILHIHDCVRAGIS